MIKPSKALVFCALIVTALLPRTSFADGAGNGAIDDSADTPIKYFPAREYGIPGKYVVMLSPYTSASPELLVGEVGGRSGFVYQNIFKGFEADLTDDQAEELSRNNLVVSVFQDHFFRHSQTSSILPNCYQGFDGMYSSQFLGLRLC